MNTLNEKQRKKIVKEFFTYKYHFDELLDYLKLEINYICSRFLKEELSKPINKKDPVIENSLRLILRDKDLLVAPNLIQKDKQKEIKLLIQNIENLETYLKTLNLQDDNSILNLKSVNNLKEIFSIFKGYI